MSVDLRLRELVWRQRRPLVGGMLCALVVSGIAVSTAALIGATVNAITKAGSDGLADRLAQLDLVAFAVVAVYLAKYAFTFGQAYFLGLATNRLAAELRERIFEHLHKLPLSFFHSQRTGSFQSMISSDVAVVQNGTTLAKDLVDAPIRLVAGLVALFVISWKLSLITLLCLPFIALLIRHIGRRVRIISGRVQAKLADVSNVVEETVSGVRVVKSFAREDYENSRFRRISRETLKEIMRGVRKTALLKPTTEVLGAFALMFALWYGGRQVLSGQLSPGGLVAFIYLLDQMAGAANSIGAISNTYAQVRAAAARIFEQLLDIEPEIRDRSGAETLPRVCGEVVFEDVSFTYPDGNLAVQNVSFTLGAGESVALVGRSGAGKSTLVDLLLRFHDVSAGRITVDGYDVRDVTQVSLRSQISVVPQHTTLFARSIMENIRYGKESATDEEVIAAAEAAYAHDFVMEKPDGYNTLLGERGVKISGGEAQRIAIARAVLRDPRILILDEATSALDAVSERAVQLAVESTRANRTTIMIAHRLSTARRADRILVMHEGCLVESGSHEELLARNSIYSAMYRAFEEGIISATAD